MNHLAESVIRFGEGVRVSERMNFVDLFSAMTTDSYAIFDEMNIIEYNEVHLSVRVAHTFAGKATV